MPRWDDDTPRFQRLLHCRVYVHGRQIMDSWVPASEAPEAAVAALDAGEDRWTEEHAEEARVVAYTSI